MPGMKGKDNPAYRHGLAQRGQKRPPVYLRWRSMMQRCYSPSDPSYANYGARGIGVCDRWRKGEDGRSGFECWLDDLGSPPFKGATIDRIDGTKGYSPDNCRWATVQEQANNRRNNRYVEAFGESHTLAQWARIVGIGPKTIRYRLEQGATPEEALRKPPNHGVKLTSTR